MSSKWTPADIPDQNGRVAIVTGANSGLGLVTARELARAGARVVLACRDEEKGREAVRAVEVRAPGSDGFELQFGTNHLGHFALTGLLLDTLEGREDARVVTLSSGVHRSARIAFDTSAASAATSAGARTGSRSSPI